MEVKLEITNLLTPFINTYKLLSAEWKHLFDIGVSDYLHSQTDKYYSTNTFLHRNEKVKFMDIYYPLTAKYKELFTQFENISDVFDEYKFITLIGYAGSGKTTMVKHIFLNCLRQNYKIPILIELRNLNEYKGDLEKLISEKILKSKIKPTDDTFKRTLESGKFLFLLDGYDEIFSDKKQDINRQIELFVDSFPENKYLITTRPGSGIERFPRFHDFHVQDLSKTDISKFVIKIVENEERRGRILQIIADQKNGNYIQYLKNPLLLSMFILAFESHPEIPEKKSAFYRNVFDTLYSRHDGITKNSFPREKLTNLQRSDFEKILNIFSYLTLSDGQYSYTYEYLSDMLSKTIKSLPKEIVVDNLIYDLQTSISILVVDGLEYKFPHRSMQEYFTAQFISTLSPVQKSKAYTNLNERIIKASTDNSFNFWSLCFELDRSTFIKSFLIPELKKIDEILNEIDDIKLMNAYIQLRELKIRPNKEHGLAVTRASNFHSAFLKFSNCYNYIMTNLVITEDKEIVEELKALDQSGNRIPFNDEQVILLLSKSKYPSKIREYRLEVQSKIREFEQDIIDEANNIDEILNG